MRVYAGMDPRMPLAEVGAYAARVEALGFDGLHVPETIHDAFAVAVLAAEHTTTLTIRTAVALAFVRSPTLTAYAAWDLARFSGGRFELGLGSQIRQNVEDRYGMPWSEPVARMAEHLDALEALFDAFASGGPVRHDGPHHRITRLQPYFNPGPDEATRRPAVYLGGVNPRMCRLAGARAAGFLTHPTNSDPRYLREVCVPNLRAGADEAGRSLDAGFELVVGTPVITGADGAAVQAAREHQRRTLAFLYSTPAYARTLELHGWTELGDDLRALVRDDRWDDLATVVDDEVLDALVPTGTYDELPAVLLKRYGGLGSGLALPPLRDPATDDPIARLVAALRAGA